MIVLAQDPPLIFVLGFTLVDVSSLYPQLIRKPGMTKWKPPVDKELNLFDSYEGYLESVTEEKRKATKMVKTQWPPDNVGELHLDRWYVHRPLLQRINLTPGSACGCIHICKILVGFSSRCSKGPDLPIQAGTPAGEGGTRQPDAHTNIL